LHSKIAVSRWNGTVSNPDETSTDRLLESAAEVGRRASEGRNSSDLLLAVGQAVISALQVEVCSVWELLPEKSVLLRSVVGAVDWTIDPHAEPAGDSPVGRAIVSRAPVIVNDLKPGLHFSESSFLAQQGLVGSLIVPIFAGQHVAGAVGAHTRGPRDFSTGQLHYLQIIASAISSLIESDTESAKRQKHLLRVEQMMALGQVAAGVAHELRNPLTAIKGLIQVNRKELEDRRIPAEDLRVIEHEIRRMERSLQNFLDFARPPVPKRRPLLLSNVIERVISLVEGRARKQHVRIEGSQPAEPQKVIADQDLIQQLLLNLVLNALDAMPHGGTILVKVQPEADDTVLVTVRDNGPGIAAHILPVIFERFVSSKETGVGLGLPVSRRIAQEHGGDLAVENLPEGGASFSFTLPLATAQAT